MRRLHKRSRRGSFFEFIMEMTDSELDRLCASVEKLIPPKGVKVYFNGKKLERKDPVISFTCYLETQIENESGDIIRANKEGEVLLYEAAGEGWIYEMGIPIERTGDRFHYNVMQKIPVNMDRSAVLSSYYKQRLRAQTLVAAIDHLNEDDVSSHWVAEGLERGIILNNKVIAQILYLRYGDKYVAFDPDDEEANHIAAGKGYAVISPSSFTNEAWKVLLDTGLVKPAGYVTPSPKAEKEDGTPIKGEVNISPEMLKFATFVKNLGWLILGTKVPVTFANDPDWKVRAAFTTRKDSSDCGLTVNVAHLGRGFFLRPTEDMFSTLIHEFAHYYEKNHLKAEFYEKCCEIGAKLAFIAGDAVMSEHFYPDLDFVVQKRNRIAHPVYDLGHIRHVTDSPNTTK